MEEYINELLDLLKQAEPVARKLKDESISRPVGEIDAYFTYSNIEKAIGHLNCLKVLIG